MTHFPSQNEIQQQQPFFSIITATIGCPYFCKLLESINKQSFLHIGNIEHIIAIDNAPKNKKTVEEQIQSIQPQKNINRIRTKTCLSKVDLKI
jgi:hypothetical protein